MRGLGWAATGALLLKLALALWTTGSNDALTWEQNLVRLDSAGFGALYRDGVQYNSPAGKAYPAQAFIHPPGVLHLLRILGKLAQFSGWRLSFWLRAACALADAGVLAMLLWAGCASGRALWLLALSPISILISGFHGNTDPILVLLVVAAVLLVERERPLGAGLAFGLACSIKLIPLLYAPLIFFHWRRTRDRLGWMTAGAAAWTALSWPYLFEDPALILRTMLGYTGATGLWGFSLLPTLLGSASGQAWYAAAARWVALAGAAAAPLLLRRRLGLLSECGLITFAFLFLSPGFGLQYLAWTVPWTVRLDFSWMAGHHALFGGFLFVVYLSASRMTPGYADLLAPENLTFLILLGVPCWMELGLAARHWAGQAVHSRYLAVWRLSPGGDAAGGPPLGGS